MIEEELTGRIIKCFYKVYNTLGHGFIERVYHNSMVIELAEQGFQVDVERPITVYYGGHVVGTFSADLLVEDLVIVELKAKERLIEAHEAQLLNYLRSTEIELGLLFNFGKAAEFKRKYFSNSNKASPSQRKESAALAALFGNDPFESA